MMKWSLLPVAVCVVMNSSMSGTLMSLAHDFFLFVFEALLSAKVATVFEHIPGIGVQTPEGTFTRFVRRARHFNETIVER